MHTCAHMHSGTYAHANIIWCCSQREQKVFLLCFQIDNSRRPIYLLIPIHIMSIWHFQAMFHKEFARIRLALTVEWLVVDDIQLTYLVHLVGIKTSHLHSWQVTIVEVGKLPPVEHCLVLSLAHIHNGRQALVVVRRYQAIEVAKLYHFLQRAFSSSVMFLG